MLSPARKNPHSRKKAGGYHLPFHKLKPCTTRGGMKSSGLWGTKPQGLDRAGFFPSATNFSRIGCARLLPTELEILLQLFQPRRHILSPREQLAVLILGHGNKAVLVVVQDGLVNVVQDLC